MKDKLTQAELKRLLHYSPWTGKFTWRVDKGNHKSGDVAGSLSANGYVRIKINGEEHLAHRLAHLYMKGYFPEYDMDHKKGIRDDNRWRELKHVTRICNSQNKSLDKRNTSGFPGVSWNKKERKWTSSIMVNKKQIYLGQYKDIIEAALARFTFEEQCSEWTCNNRSDLVNAIRNAWPEFNF